MKKKEKEQTKTIRTPKLPAVIFFVISLGLLFSAFCGAVLPIFMENATKHTPWKIISDLILGIANLTMSVLLFKKEYNKKLIYASILILISSLLTITEITIFSIGNTLFSILLIGYTYIMIHMPESPIREKTVKLRFIIPLYDLVFLIISTIQAIHSLSEFLTNKSGAELTEDISKAVVVIPSFMFLPSGIIMVIGYILLVNWLANPYERK